MTVRVVHLISELSTGGAQAALASLVLGLDRRFSPAVVCFARGSDPPGQRLHQAGIPITDLGMGSKLRLDALGRLYFLLRRQKPAILHTWMFHANLAGRLLGRAAGIPVIVTSRRNTEIGGPWRERLTRWTAGLDDHVVAVCEAARQVEIQRARVPAGKVSVIYNGLDPQPFLTVAPEARQRVRQELGVSPETVLVGAAGRLHPQKGLADLLTAFGQVSQAAGQVCLLLAGEGALRPELESQARQDGISGRVIFSGLRSNIPELFSALDLFVSSSYWEGLSNSILEAMAAGLPVVATRVGGTPELVVDGLTGRLVPPGDPPRLAQAIQALASSPAGRWQMGSSGRQRVQDHFTLAETIHQNEALYQRLLEQKGLA